MNRLSALTLGILAFGTQAQSLEADYFWWLGEETCTPSGEWTKVKTAQVPGNYTETIMVLEDGEYDGAMVFLPREEGYFGEMSATVAWDDSQAPNINFRRAVRIVFIDEETNIEWTTAQDTAFHIRNEGEPIEGYDALFYHTAYLQPGVKPNQLAVSYIEIWQNSGAEQCITIPENEHTISAPLIMYTGSSKFK